MLSLDYQLKEIQRELDFYDNRFKEYKKEYGRTEIPFKEEKLMRLVVYILTNEGQYVNRNQDK